MKTKIILLFALSLIFTTSTAFAQQNFDNFLGTWKLDFSLTKPLDKFSVQPMTLNVTEANDSLIVEKSIQNSNKTAPLKDVYKISGGTNTTVIGGFLGGVEYRRLKFLKTGKLELVSKVTNDYGIRSIRATWELSEDGKTLTVRQNYRISQVDSTETSGTYISTKLVFTKQ